MPRTPVGLSHQEKKTWPVLVLSWRSPNLKHPDVWNWSFKSGKSLLIQDRPKPWLRVVVWKNHGILGWPKRILWVFPWIRDVIWSSHVIPSWHKAHTMGIRMKLPSPWPETGDSETLMDMRHGTWHRWCTLPTLYSYVWALLLATLS
jgi:hypothetical protein